MEMLIQNYLHNHLHHTKMDPWTYQKKKKIGSMDIFQIKGIINATIIAY